MSVRLRVHKASRRLELWEEGVCLGAWPCHLGRVPEGPKRREGDGRTPEGEFYVCTRNGGSRFHRFLGLSYPRPSDMEAGLLRPDQIAAIAETHAKGLRPPWDTPLGGQIGLHGAPNGRPMPPGDWTEGCIAVDDAVMDLLWDRCTLGTAVHIA